MKAFFRKYFIPFVVLPCVTAVGIFVFEGKRYTLISLVLVLLALLTFFMSFEKSKADSRKIALVAALTALSVAGRLVFALVPGFKPVTALVIITAIYLGSEAGFVTGAMTAALSNFYFGQGPWTPFQMLSWGLIGFFAGLISKQLKNSRILLCIYGAISGVAFSLIMDVWTVQWYDNAFNFSMFSAAVITALPYTALYAISNIVFLLLLDKPIGKKLERVKIKYG